MEIHTAAKGGNEPSLAAWCFIVNEEIIHCSGCLMTTERTANAMAILQALYWLRENGYKKATIYTSWRDAITESIIAKRIQDILPPEVTVVQSYDKNTAYAIAHNTLTKLRRPDMDYSDAEVGQLIVKKEPLWSQSYMVMLKSLVSKTITLRNLTTASKRMETFTQDEFNCGKFILL